MAQDNERFGIIRCSSDDDERLDAPEADDPVPKPWIHGRVCRILSEDGGYSIVRCAGARFKIRAENISPASNVRFEVGDKVRYKDR